MPGTRSPQDASEAQGPSWFVPLRLNLCRVVPVVSVLCFLGWCYVSVRATHAWDDADPEILNQAWRLAQGESIYRTIDEPPYVHTAYPPVYFVIVALLLKLTGLSYLPAKLVSLAAAVSIGVAMARLSRQWRGNTRAGIWGAFFFFLIPAVLYNTVRTHVQMLAVALSIWSFVFFLRGRFISTAIVSPLLAVLAIYTKQTQVALPLAMGIYLLLRRRAWLFPYLMTVAIAGLMPFWWLLRATDGHFWRNIVELNSLSYNPLDILPIFIHHAGPILLFIALALVTLRKRFARGDYEPIDFYFAVSLVVTLLTLGRLGAHTQYVVEFCAVTLLFLIRTTGLSAMPGRGLLLSCQIILLLIYTPLYVAVEEGRFGMASNRAAERIYPLLETARGPILSQQGSFALFGAGAIHIQLGHFAALSRAGLWDENKLRLEIESSKFMWVVTEWPIEEPIERSDDIERFNPAIVDALRRNYSREAVILPYFVYRPTLHRSRER